MAQSSSAAIAGTIASSRGQTSPPILSIIPLVTLAFSAGLSIISHVVSLLNIIVLSLLSPFLVLVPITIYLFSPLIISSKLLFDLCIVLPYRAAVYIFQAIYPLYTFIGVACLSGAIIGVGARQIVSLVGWALLGGEVRSTRRSASPSRARAQKRPSASARGKRRVTMRTDD